MGFRKVQVQIQALEPESSGNLGKLLNHNCSVYEMGKQYPHLDGHSGELLT